MNKRFEDDPHVAVGRLLVRTSRRRFQLCDLLLERLGIGPGQMPVLGELSHHRQMTQRELAEHTHVTPATISGTLKRMERAGLVKREEDKRDARVSIVTLTEKGELCSEEAVRLFMETDRNMLEGFSDEELAEVNGYLARMYENVIRSLEHAQAAERKEGDVR